MIRIYHYDVARGAYLLPDVFIKAIRLAAASGFTHFLPYLENMVRLPSMEKSCPACAYTQEQWRKFESDAGESGIQLMPHFNVIGHTGGAASAYPELFVRDSGGRKLDVTLEATRAWTARCLDEFCDFSSGRYFMIGGDEWQAPAQMLADPDFSVARAWAGQVNLACERLVARGRIPIVWHDMLAHYPEALELVSRDAVIALWFYDEDSDYPFLDLLKKRGFKTIMASGTCAGLMTRRVVRALDCALKASDRHTADGLMMTSWEQARWEKLSVVIPMVGAILRGATVPEEVLRVSSALDVLDKLPAESPWARACRSRLATLADDKIWSAYPEFREYLASVLTEDVDRERASFLRYHYAAGRILEVIDVKRKTRNVICGESAVIGQETAVVKRTTYPPVIPAEFRLAVADNGGAGPSLRFMNGDETFVIYPRFGGTLQDWRVGGTTIIPHALPEFLRGNIPPPGGYGSYTLAGVGFRPIWALGLNSNPCILWQGPFEWKVAAESEDMIAVELSRMMLHVDVRYTVTARKGTSGFTFRAEAVNKLEGAYGAFNFNLLLTTQPQDFEETAFAWTEDGRERRLPLPDFCDSFFRLPAVREMTVVKPGYSVCIGCDPAKTAGFYVDWSDAYLTPDVRGLYRIMRVGQREIVEWRFTGKAHN
jgi:hypothetical protein